jgi:hypothetical protein
VKVKFNNDNHFLEIITSCITVMITKLLRSTLFGHRVVPSIHHRLRYVRSPEAGTKQMNYQINDIIIYALGALSFSCLIIILSNISEFSNLVETIFTEG